MDPKSVVDKLLNEGFGPPISSVKRESANSPTKVGFANKDEPSDIYYFTLDDEGRAEIDNLISDAAAKTNWIELRDNEGWFRVTKRGTRLRFKRFGPYSDMEGEIDSSALEPFLYLSNKQA